MRPIPVAFHIWFLEVHTYGIGLALTFWFALRYTERRLRKAGYPWHWVTGTFLWVIVAALVGARALHVVSDWGDYAHNLSQIPAIWAGGLSSFGGLLFAVPTAIVSSRRRCPELPTLRFGDLMAPVLMASWAIGRLLGPQLMRGGGGHPTTAWFGMYYAGEAGRRLPVPIFQAMEDAAIFGALLLVERWLRNRTPMVPAAATVASDEAEADVETTDAGTADPGDPGDGEATDGSARRGAGLVPLLPPAGLVLGVGMILWGIERFLDEHLWLGEDSGLGSDLTQLAGILLAVAGIVLLITRYRALREWLDTGSTGAGEDGTEPGPEAGDESGPVAVPEFAGHGDGGASSDGGSAAAGGPSSSA